MQRCRGPCRPFPEELRAQTAEAGRLLPQAFAPDCTAWNLETAAVRTSGRGGRGPKSHGGDAPKTLNEGGLSAWLQAARGGPCPEVAPGEEGQVGKEVRRKRQQVVSGWSLLGSTGKNCSHPEEPCGAHLKTVCWGDREGGLGPQLPLVRGCHPPFPGCGRKAPTAATDNPAAEAKPAGQAGCCPVAAGGGRGVRAAQRRPCRWVGREASLWRRPLGRAAMSRRDGPGRTGRASQDREVAAVLGNREAARGVRARGRAREGLAGILSEGELVEGPQKGPYFSLRSTGSEQEGLLPWAGQTG